MDEVQLHHVSEQRCKRFGCAYMNCLQNNQGNQVKCMPLFRSLQACKADEMQKIKEEFSRSGVQPLMQEYPKQKSCIPQNFTQSE